MALEQITEQSAEYADYRQSMMSRLSKLSKNSKVVENPNENAANQEVKINTGGKMPAFLNKIESKTQANHPLTENENRNLN